ncbi:MAG: YicC family protein [Spirochaetaceae bacterium]|nr:YicC family protein [Spirochaetaceae bacterium]
MKNMTAYTHVESMDGLYSVELKGYNSRFLEISLLLPQFLPTLEPVLRKYLSRKFRRGKIELRIKVETSKAKVAVMVNMPLLQAYKKACDEIAQYCSGGSATAVDLATLINLSNTNGLFTVEQEHDTATDRKRIASLVKIATKRFEEERSREGHITQDAISAQLESLEHALVVIQEHAPDVERSTIEEIHKRFKELCDNTVYSIDENRILAETAVLLAKYTITEEIQRLSAHLAEFRAEMARNESPGKKLDFLCQEMNREINTIGSKTPLLAISREVVSMKDALENIREQLRNVE